MRRWLPVPATLVLAALAVAAPAAAAEKWKLRLDLAEGASQRYAMTTVQDLDLQLGELGQQKGQTTLRFEFSQRVKERRPGGGLTLEIVYDRVKMDVNMGGFSMSFDSAAPGTAEQNPMLANSLGKLVGESIDVRISRRGEIEAVTGFERLWDEIAAEAGDEPATRQAMEALRKNVNSDTMAAMMQHGSMVFPEQAVKAGDAWEHEAQVPNPMMGTMHLRTRYEVQGAEARSGRDCVKISTAQEFDLEGTGPLLEQLQQLFGPGGRIDWKVERAEAAGTVWIDPSNGLNVACESNQKMAFNVALTIPQADGEPRKMDFQVAIDQDMRVELLD